MKMKNYYTVATNKDQFPSINSGYLTIGHGVSAKNKKHSKKDVRVFLKEIEAAKLMSIANAEEYVSRHQHAYEDIKDDFRKELKMLNGLSFRIVHVSFEDVK